MCGFLAMAGGDSPLELMEAFWLAKDRLQHRGQDSTGVAWSDGRRVRCYKGRGLISQVLTQGVYRAIAEDNPKMLIFHTRYSTSGADTDENAQPHWIEDHRGRVALASNGDVPDLEVQKAELEKEGLIFFTENDAEFLLKKISHIIYQERPDWRTDYLHGIRRLMETTRATYSAGLLTGTRLYVIRDPYENRPLWIGRRGSLFVAASETCVFDRINAQVEREVIGGEIIQVERSGESTSTPVVPRRKPKHCIFEKIYFARPDSWVFSHETCASFRRRLGVRMWHYEQELAQNWAIDGMVGVPDSGSYFAEGYATVRKVPYRHELVRDIYTHRTFIEPDQEMRQGDAERKYVALNDVAVGIYTVDGKEILPPMPRIGCGEDTIVRLTTLKTLVRKITNAGFKEIHIRISAPKIISRCPYGIVFKPGELIGADHTEEEIQKMLGVDSLLYLPLPELKEVIQQGGEDPEDYCLGCFEGNEPI